MIMKVMTMEEKTMNTEKRNSLAARWFIRIGLGLALLALSLSASARTAAGWTSYHVYPPSASSCLGEYYGAVVNNCSFQVDLRFDTVVDNAGSHTIYVTNSPNGYGAVTCQALDFPGTDTYYPGETKTFNPSGQQTLGLNVYVYGGHNMVLSCSVPPQRGISNVNWNP